MALSSLVVVLSQLNIYQIYCPVAGWSLVKVICLACVINICRPYNFFSGLRNIGAGHAARTT